MIEQDFPSQSSRVIVQGLATAVEIPTVPEQVIEVHMTNNTLLRQKRPPPGTRPAPLV